MPDPTILVVEDEVAIRRFLRAALVNQGYRLFEADTGADALEAAATRHPTSSSSTWAFPTWTAWR